jgi:CRP/FNR family transcriptional regulator, anaerobic regulatory protein
MLTASTFRTLFDHLTQMVDLSSGALENMLSKVKPVTLKKREHWLRPGEVCDSVAFINTGCVRIYFPRSGTERTGQFFFEKSWVSDYESLHGKAPSLIGIDALEETELLVLAYADVERLYQEFPEAERLGRLIAEQVVVNLCNRYRSLLDDSPLERYVKLIEQQPQVLSRIPQHYIASFLGIEPESLSRIRKKITVGVGNRT